MVKRSSVGDVCDTYKTIGEKINQPFDSLAFHAFALPYSEHPEDDTSLIGKVPILEKRLSTSETHTFKTS